MCRAAGHPRVAATDLDWRSTSPTSPQIEVDSGPQLRVDPGALFLKSRLVGDFACRVLVGLKAINSSFPSSTQRSTITGDAALQRRISYVFGSSALSQADDYFFARKREKFFFLPRVSAIFFLAFQSCCGPPGGFVSG